MGCDLLSQSYKSFVACGEKLKCSPTLPAPFSYAMILIKKFLATLDPQLVHSDLSKFKGDPMKALGQVRSNTDGVKWPKSAKNELSIQDGGFPVRFRASATLTFLTGPT